MAAMLLGQPSRDRSEAPPPPWRALGRWHNVSRVARSAVASFRTGNVRLNDHELHRLRRAERRGLQLMILCRTVLFGVTLAWYVGSLLVSGDRPTSFGIVFLLCLTALGLPYARAIGTRFDRPFTRGLAMLVDIGAISALFVFLPVYQGGDLPQIYAFRTSNVTVLLPMIALATLSLSPGLVLWSGLSTVVCWMSAYIYVVANMERRVSWSDIPSGATRAQYDAIVLSPDFIARGSRMNDAIIVSLITIFLAIAVARARRVFYAQVAAESDRERERAARAQVRDRLGRYVPAAVAEHVLSAPDALAPAVRHAAALFMDITGFSSYAHDRDPEVVIAALNAFLARAADAVGAAGGVVITFTGDGLLATFNTPLDIDAPEAAAVEAGRALVECGRAHGFGVRVGIAAGSVASGSVGSADRQAFTVYGDTVNRAARLEELAKALGLCLVVDEACAAAVPGLSARGSHSLRGVGEAVPVWCDESL